MKGYEFPTKILNNIIKIFEQLDMAKDIFQYKVDETQPNLKTKHSIASHQQAFFINK